MVNTFLSQADQALKLEFEQFAKNKLAPIASELINGKTSANAFLKQLAQAGYLGLNVPAQYGGKDSPLLHLALLSEALANYEIGIVLYLAYHYAAIELLKAYGSDKQKSTYLPKLAQGEFIGTLAYLESAKASTGNNGDSETTSLEQDISPLNVLKTKVITQNDSLILSGKKECVVLTKASSNVSASGSVPNPSNLVFLLTDTGFIVFDNLSEPSIQIEKQNMPLALVSLYMARLSFENQVINKNAYLGEASTAPPLKVIEQLTFARNIIKTIIAAAALGMSERVLKETTDHTKIAERGGTPLAQSEAIQWKLADAAADIAAARLLTYRAACSNAENKEQFSLYVAMAKTQATRAARCHTGEGLQIILPFLQDQNIDFPLTSFYVDSKILEVFDATNEEEKLLLSRLLGI